MTTGTNLVDGIGVSGNRRVHGSIHATSSTGARGRAGHSGRRSTIERRGTAAPRSGSYEFRQPVTNTHGRRGLTRTNASTAHQGATTNSTESHNVAISNRASRANRRRSNLQSSSAVEEPQSNSQELNGTTKTASSSSSIQCKTDTDGNTLNAVCSSILSKLEDGDKRYHVFRDPVDPAQFPDYYDVIDSPMNFTTIRDNLASGRYTTLELFSDDVYLCEYMYIVSVIVAVF